MTSERARELLAATHTFPGPYTIKAIGSVADDFVARVTVAARSVLPTPGDVEHSTRYTPDGRHVAVTLLLQVVSPDDIIQVYRALQVLVGLKMLI